MTTLKSLTMAILVHFFKELHLVPSHTKVVFTKKWNSFTRNTQNCSLTLQEQKHTLQHPVTTEKSTKKPYIGQQSIQKNNTIKNIMNKPK